MNSPVLHLRMRRRFGGLRRAFFTSNKPVIRQPLVFWSLLGLLVLGAWACSPLTASPESPPERVNFAAIAQKASIEAVSSRLDDPDQCSNCADPRDVIGGSFSEYFSGEKGNFIFDIGDLDQFLIVDLGRTRVLDRVGVSFPGGRGDRQVFDFVEVLTSGDGENFIQSGIVGEEGIGDQLDYTLVSPVSFDLNPPEKARFVKYRFGRHSPDNDGGSRIFGVFAEGLD